MGQILPADIQTGHRDTYEVVCEIFLADLQVHIQVGVAVINVFI